MGIIEKKDVFLTGRQSEAPIGFNNRGDDAIGVSTIREEVNELRAENVKLEQALLREQDKTQKDPELGQAIQLAHDARRQAAALEEERNQLRVQLEAAKAEVKKWKALDPRYPIQEGPSVPRSVMAPHEAQAQRNHEQSLARLAQRGGLGCSEAWRVVNDLTWRQGTEKYGTEENMDKLWKEFATKENEKHDALTVECDRLRTELEHLNECDKKENAYRLLAEKERDEACAENEKSRNQLRQQIEDERDGSAEIECELRDEIKRLALTNAGLEAEYKVNVSEIVKLRAENEKLKRLHDAARADAPTGLGALELIRRELKVPEDATTLEAVQKLKSEAVALAVRYLYDAEEVKLMNAWAMERLKTAKEIIELAEAVVTRQ